MEDKGAPGIDAADIVFADLKRAKEYGITNLTPQRNPLAISTNLQEQVDKLKDLIRVLMEQEERKAARQGDKPDVTKKSGPQLCKEVRAELRFAQERADEISSRESELLKRLSRARRAANSLSQYNIDKMRIELLQAVQ